MTDRMGMQLLNIVPFVCFKNVSLVLYSNMFANKHYNNLCGLKTKRRVHATQRT